MMAILGSLRPVSIILAPSVGGILGSKYGWRTVFFILSGWGIMNISATQLLLVETLPVNQNKDKNENSGSGGGYWRGLFEDTKTILRHADSFSLILTMSLIFSAPSSMLSNIAFLLQYYGLNASASSLLIGSLPCMMILAGGSVALCGGRSISPKTIMTFGMFSLFLSGVAAIGVGTSSVATGPPFAHHHALHHPQWLLFMLPLYLMVFSQSLFIPPGMSVYLQPWGDRAGFASGIMSFFRTFLSTALAFLSTTVTDREGPPGFLFFIAVLLFLANVVFCVVPPFSNSEETRRKESAEEVDAEMEEMFDHMQELPTVSDGAWLLEDKPPQES